MSSSYYELELMSSSYYELELLAFIQHVDSDNNSSDYEVIFQDDFTDIDSSFNTEKILNSDSDEENSSIAKLTNFIYDAQMAKAADALLPVKDRKPLCNDPNYKKRRNLGYDFWERNKQKKLEKKLLNEDDHAVHLLIPMIGSVVPTEPDQITQRTLPEDAIGSSYFYYEHIHLSNPMIGSVVSYQTRSDNSKNTSRRCYEHIHLPNSMIGSVVSYQTRSDNSNNISRRCYEHIHLPNSMIDNSKNTSRRCYEHIHLPNSMIGFWGLYQTRSDNSKNTSRRCYEHTALVPLESDEVEILLEVAFYCLGIILKTDVQELNDDRLEQLMNSFNGLDLVVGGIQCNNLTGRNKHHSWA
ncbi:DNA (Cytosine-5)-methyltransferase DRM1/2 isoform 2 [Hibiscus syriacus]|uniref:DNA (Cytosine-5)-methyltransferase DRM1/2 isoform 2 n=1 Tax=Hibiscus syriacus TaxID=106335 RepID=A0A6A3AUG5_HIBSY|nr:DNA (Cytosine-5)-methyltransferase DRM1/2 isoform 2 [Hibiscus syriacus]